MADEARDTQYTLGYGKQGNAFSQRTASVEAGFFLPHLKPGMSVLDCGCGSGSITLGLAEAVVPGELIGLDIGEAAIAHARNLVKERGISNVQFDVGNINEIPFEDASFDAVFSHNVLEHLSNPFEVLKEMYRVLKPNGVIGLSDIDINGFFVSPPEDPVNDMFTILYRVWEHNGGNPRIGKHLGRLLDESGFNGVRVTARLDCFGSSEEIALGGEETAIAVLSSSLETAARLGWAEPATREQVSELWYAFAAKPGAFFNLTFCQAVGWKE